MNMLDHEARSLAGLINNPLGEIIENVLTRTRQDVLEDLANADDEKQMRRLQGKARALKDASGMFREAYELCQAESRKRAQGS